jgi:hypothetical protein
MPPGQETGEKSSGTERHVDQVGVTHYGPFWTWDMGFALFFFYSFFFRFARLRGMLQMHLFFNG